MTNWLVYFRCRCVNKDWQLSKSPSSSVEHFTAWKCSSWKGILNDLIHDLYSNLIFLAASECWSWILYYSIPVMHDILPATYMYINHHAKLVTSMHICFSDRINHQQLQLVEQQLHEFYRDYQDLYDNKLGHVLIFDMHCVDLKYRRLHRYYECSLSEPHSRVHSQVGSFMGILLLSIWGDEPQSKK